MPRQICICSGSNIRSPLLIESLSVVYHFANMFDKKHSGKADKLTLANGTSEYAWLFSVAMY